MGKLPYFPFYPGDWLKDPKLSQCSPATRGVWIDLICGLRELGRSGTLTANSMQISRLCRCSVAEVDAALNELQTHGAADVYQRNGIYTVICRRLKRSADISAKRQQAALQRHSKTETRPVCDTEEEVRKKVEGYCTELGLPSTDGTAVYDKWQGNGWTNNGKPIRDWKATIRTWKQYGYLPSQKQRNGARDDRKKIDPSKIEVAERFKGWVAEKYPERREAAMQWQVWSQVPDYLRREWWHEEKAKLPVKI
jgi:uncharacterized membrane protein YkoI